MILLLMAAQSSSDNYRAVDLLLRHGADVNIQNKKGITALHAAVVSSPDAVSLIIQKNVVCYLH